jgi:hypothetical protein
MTRRKPTRYSLPDDDGTITATKLRGVAKNTKLEVMRTWFYENYADPVENTPYESAEGGYIYIWGGPYEPEEELQNEFGGLISDDIISELAGELFDISYEWTRPIGYYEDESEEFFFETIVQTTEHHQVFNEAITNVEQLLDLKIPSQNQSLLLKLLYANVITAIETYLSDIFISTVVNDKDLFRKFIEKTPEFKEKKISISDIFKNIDSIKKEAGDYLMGILWHNFGKIKPMFKDTLEVDFPDEMKLLFEAARIRHDLVHRNGKDKENKKHTIFDNTVRDLIEISKNFVSHIDSQLTKPDKLEEPFNPFGEFTFMGENHDF